MKNVICLTGAVLLGIWMLLITNTVMAGDLMPGSAHVKVLLDNSQIRVSEANRPPGTVVPMHSHSTLVAYYFSPATVKVSFPSGKTKVNKVPAGKIVWFPKGMKHSIEIMGDKNQHVLVVEWKKMMSE